MLGFVLGALVPTGGTGVDEPHKKINASGSMQMCPAVITWASGTSSKRTASRPYGSARAGKRGSSGQTV